ncbi:DUF3265 domain-containing protein [Vibrio crassostreae]|uniref:DUF3265 domain-containing protein n=1 Tax=Vibrio crassostreae TaxID=246167 RepID=A0ABM9QPE4_9VIBR|nr:DUF3265 domain-containing protein [Vibrio crassostreae]CAK1709489.1 DUF3265 domain-containing protein [Vibrio crassostreae]CAK1846268.1 DUF3265 domain-containing protein [Vibrio crassostreae]CAK1849657.1 DUF3265 domain-containing protein [Vibrio crassostreae]CAK1850813.1 DUF3265 domain-containing protein [Vibrio crassostreae]
MFCSARFIVADSVKASVQLHGLATFVARFTVSFWCVFAI